MGELPLVDLDVIAELRNATGGDMDFVRELVETYVEETGGYLEALAGAVAANDVAAAVRPAHTLKSSSASVGAMRLAELARGIEESSRGGRPDGLADAVDRVRTTWAETLAALRAEGLAA